MMLGNLLLIFSMFLHASAIPDPDVNIKINIKVNGEAMSDGSDNGSDQSTVKCGLSTPSDTRIINGSPVNSARKYPWQVALSLLNGSSYSAYCGGSVITNKHILTAAHCFDDYQFFYIGIGTNKNNKSSIIIPQKGYMLHQNYSFPHYDIAIIELSEPIDLKENDISPICIPMDDSNKYVGINATASGWGSTVGYNPDQNPAPAYPYILQEAQIPVLSKTKCEQDIGGFVEAYMLCAGDDKGFENGGKDPCQGDSGGPLTVQENGQYQQIGVVSGGVGCASKGNPGFYARVTYYIDWIKEHVAPEKIFTASKP